MRWYVRNTLIFGLILVVLWIALILSFHFDAYLSREIASSLHWGLTMLIIVITVPFHYGLETWLDN